MILVLRIGGVKKYNNMSDIFWIIVFALIFYFFGRMIIIYSLHTLFEIGQNDSLNYKIGRIMYTVTKGVKNKATRLDFFHKTLDVLPLSGYLEFKIDNQSHRDHWTLVNIVSLEIKRIQGGLNIPLFWLENSYEEAIDTLKK